MRADLHVHSLHSGYTGNLPFFRSLDCYSTPEQVYQRAKARGMDLVTITDHDTIDGCLRFLDQNPAAADFIIGEEVECRHPDVDLTIHVGVLGLDERIHRNIQPLREDVFALVAYLHEQRLPFAFNHPFMFYQDQMDLLSYVSELMALFPGMEVRNGAMLSMQNALVEKIRAHCGGSDRTIARFGGSDAHCLRSVGATYTEALASSREEFLQKLMGGETQVGGRHGSTSALAAEIYGVIFNFWASLLGRREQELNRSERIEGLLFSFLSLPVQFIPFLVAASKKMKESRQVARLTQRWLDFVKSSATPETRALQATSPSEVT